MVAMVLNMRMKHGYELDPPFCHLAKDKDMNSSLPPVNALVVMMAMIKEVIFELIIGLVKHEGRS